MDWLTCGDPSKFLSTPALFLINSKACCAAVAFAVFLLFPVPLHLNKLPTFTSQVNNFMLESPSSSSTGWKKTDSPTWAAISNNKLTEFLFRFWGCDKISFISRSLLSAIFFCRIVDQLGGAIQMLFVRYWSLLLIWMANESKCTSQNAFSHWRPHHRLKPDESSICQRRLTMTDMIPPRSGGPGGGGAGGGWWTW